MKLGKF